MLRYSQFQLRAIQAALFTPDTSHFSQPGVLSGILTRYAQRFDGPVQALPLPPDVPPDVPRVILQSTDGAYRFHAGPARIDSFRLRNDPHVTDTDLARDCVEVLEHYLRVAQPSLRVGRLALVVTRLTFDPNAAWSLIDRFCSAETRMQPFNRSKHFEIHNHKEYMLDPPGLPVNSWVRCKAVTILEPQPGEAVLVEQDINTLEGDLMQHAFDVNTISAFFASAAAEADSILRLYFPERNAT